MNRTEAAHVLAVMAAPFPWDVDDDQAEVWYEVALKDCDPTDGMEIAKRIVANDERFPSPGRFNREREVLARYRHLADAGPGLPLPRMPVDEAKARIAEARAALRGGQ